MGRGKFWVKPGFKHFFEYHCAARVPRTRKKIWYKPGRKLVQKSWDRVARC